MKNKNLAIAILTTGLLASGSARADGCGDFNNLEKVLASSPNSMADLTVAASNRLGYGVNPYSVLNPEKMAKVEKELGRSFAALYLAEAIRNSFRHANHVHAAPLAQVEAMYPETYGWDVDARMTKYLDLRAQDDGFAHQHYARHILNAMIARKIIASMNGGSVNAGESLGYFWFNHFNTDNGSSMVRVFTPDYELKLRKKMCGTFLDMLVASSHHPAMSVFLDNSRNVKGKINENYGREIIELHTLGTGPVTGFRTNGTPIYAYKQEEIFESARVLSGWNYKSRPELDFAFLEGRHDNGNKVFPMLFQPVTGGKVVIGGGYKEGRRFLELLVQHPRTKFNICRKLGRHMLGFSPDRELVDTCILAYGKYGNLGRMYESYLLNPAFWERVNVGTKNPLELTISMYRGLGINGRQDLVQNAKFVGGVNGVLTKMGFQLFQFGPPTGQPYGSYWASPSLINTLLTASFRSIPYLPRSWGGLEGQALENRVATLPPEVAVALVTKAMLPVHYKMDGLSIQNQLVNGLKSGRPDKVKGKKAPARSVATQAVSSGLFMRK